MYTEFKSNKILRATSATTSIGLGPKSIKFLRNSYRRNFYSVSFFFFITPFIHKFAYYLFIDGNCKWVAWYVAPEIQMIYLLDCDVMAMTRTKCDRK